MQAEGGRTAQAPAQCPMHEGATPSSPSNAPPGTGRVLGGFARIGRFGLVSGIGLALDFCISVGLREVEALPFVANLVGAACAVTFVFFASVRHVFESGDTGRARKYAAYMLWQAVAVPAASGAIALLTPLGVRVADWAAAWGGDIAHGVAQRPGAGFLIAKCAVTPLTFYANFLFMGWLLTGRLRWR